MTSPIVVDKLSKKFDINKLKRNTQLREALVNFVRLDFLRNQQMKEEIWALKNVSFSIEKGEIVGIIGRNGAGKSTLLKIMSRITYPTSGEIKIVGRVGSLLEVGTGFHDELTGRENIFLNGSILGMKKSEVKRKLDEIIAFSEVEKYLDTPIKWYSSGMRLKLGFSVAAHLDTDILFVDEVLAVGDVAFQRKCLDTMKDLRNSGRTVIFVSHTMTTVETLCPRVIWLDKGELLQDGPSRDVIYNYLSQFSGRKHQARIDFTSIPNREGSGEIRYAGIEFLNSDGQIKEKIHSGDSLKVRLYYQVNETISKPEFYVQVFSEMNVKITTIGTCISHYVLPTLTPGTGYIDFDIDCLDLLPGRYYFDLWINSNNVLISYNIITHDALYRCATLDVDVRKDSDFDEETQKWWGNMYMPCKWNFEGLNNQDDPVKNER